jgi:hypothetical protein
VEGQNLLPLLSQVLVTFSNASELLADCRTDQWCLGMARASTSIGVVPKLSYYQIPMLHPWATESGNSSLSRALSPIVNVITNQDSTSSRLLPGSSYSCCIRNLRALVHKQCHPVHGTTAHETMPTARQEAINACLKSSSHEKRKHARMNRESLIF